MHIISPEQIKYANENAKIMLDSIDKVFAVLDIKFVTLKSATDSIIPATNDKPSLKRIIFITGDIIVKNITINFIICFQKMQDPKRLPHMRQPFVHMGFLSKSFRLVSYVRHDSQMSGSLHCDSQLSLMLCAVTGYTSGQDLAAL